MPSTAEATILIVGAGLAGALLGAALAGRGWPVTIIERRPDPRHGAASGGRSINLALADRGLAALELAGLADRVLARSVPMRGRLVHPLSGSPTFQPYSVDPAEYIRSVHRAELNALLLDAAEERGCRLCFAQPLRHVDFDAAVADVGPDHAAQRLKYRLIVGCDGAGSALRAQMQGVDGALETVEPLGHSYQELHIAAEHGHAFEREALHIWPRRDYMLIALPNCNGSFTGTLFLPDVGEPSFASLRSRPDAIERFLATAFPDLADVVPDAAEQLRDNPVGFLGTLRLDRWTLGSRALLIGDAAHAIVPFHGQGMNCAFEDVAELVSLLDASGLRDGPKAEDEPALDTLLETFVARRQPNARAIAEMALDNYLEMRDRVADPRFLALKALEARIERAHPTRYRSRYRQVSFDRRPYAQAYVAGQRQVLWLTSLLERFGAPDAVTEEAIVDGLAALGVDGR